MRVAAMIYANFSTTFFRKMQLILITILLSLMRTAELRLKEKNVYGEA